MESSTSAPARARLILEVLSPSTELLRFVLAPGAAARVGRTAVSDFVVPGDEQLSGAHFVVEWDGATAAVRDLGSAAGTRVGGAEVTSTSLRHGDWIRAGNTDFRVYHEGGRRRPPSGDATLAGGAPELCPAPIREAIQLHLQAAGEHLYTVLDAARSPRILRLLEESVDERQSLFDGPGGASLWRVAPYLVKLAPRSSGLLARLVAEGWGKSWGIYVVSDAPFKDVRRHFRRHLKVEDPNDKPMFFRFYDPRVLRRFLPMASGRQLQELFAHVGKYVVEGESPGEVHVLSLGAASGSSSPASSGAFALRDDLVTLGGAPAAENTP
jgi:pSer/pThr/pTyr-binding forkhead associated (FHA) protein